MNKEGESNAIFFIIFLVMIISLIIASLWNTIPVIKDSIHKFLDPSIGALLNWHPVWGMTLLVFLISIFMTLAQKYGTDQETLKRLKAEQKELQKEMKEFRDDPAKVLELQKKSFEFMPLMMKHSMRPIIYTGIPLILLFRWFMDYFSVLPDFKFFGFFSWFWYYLILSIIFSSILRKIMNVH
ncbi:hypothetical protein COU53_02700 [Candidatus Pacearchaeota archaeon CG10_big_fil_rev_8_21_14_0_10_30_48]|nr:MAG: hypothetical protein COU53_02700 [Candidatus Pacearchaeota archaeon CG10_big_fil_rev_8_21_14_0_10_30_48]